MKDLGLFAFSFLFSLSALAGLPADDPSVGYLRQEFVNGNTPVVENLKLGSPQKCIFYSAQKNSGKVFRFQAVFSLFGQLIRMQVPSQSVWYNELSRDLGFQLTDYGLLAHAGYFNFRFWPTYRPVYINFRASTDNEFLVAEMMVTLEKMNFESSNELVGQYAQAATHPQGFAFGYIACR